jgi:Lrp/AsnC family transcriptional regulator, leucine-responsive regulatory protein
MDSSTLLPHLDAIDLRLLDQLQRDASLSNQALAERCHVSPAACAGCGAWWRLA